MNNLMNVNQEVVMTSRDVAEMTGKEHKHVLRDIENEIKQLETAGISQPIFGQSDYTNERGKTYKCYKFGMEGALQLGARYSAETRFKMIQHIKKLEAERRAKMPQTKLEWMMLAVEQEKELIASKEEIKELTPKADYYDGVLSAENSMTITTIAKDLGMTARGLNKILNNMKIIYKLDNCWHLYKQHLGKGYTKTNTFYKTSKIGKQISMHQLRWTEKGREFIINQLSDNGHNEAIKQLKGGK